MDIPIRMIIKGDSEIEHWPQRILARLRGKGRLPTITVLHPPGSEKTGEAKDDLLNRIRQKLASILRR